MPASRTAPDLAPSAPGWKTSPVVDYEPHPQPLTAGPPKPCPVPSGEALHRTGLRPLRAHRPPALPQEQPPPRSAVTFAETALRQVIEVIDRRRPVAQLRPLMTPLLIDCVIARAAAPRTGSATLRRVRVRSAGTDAEVTAAEVFASFTRSGRVHAVAGRIERHRDGWRLVALQIG
ncbi:Rv3235 family protein [Mycobacterium sp. ITM-2016-00317]|uniref:Rv3235 family protein n=1 Tax=Mycobacterium sp. ITM-2016-00317 TaxID=2099694 RepID=UPI000D4563E3|nr:Rv3235 family protein [Mycobacterium sp. ITM-2016-00317]WNG89014.1 Rv3235 family protein [Mycobacterium sp. ITM-2016-00317]